MTFYSTIIIVILSVCLVPMISGITAPTLVKDGEFSMVEVGRVGNKTYYWDTFNLFSPWATSLDTCHRAGMFMASIESEGEQNFLATRGAFMGWSKYLNIAGTDLFSEGTWRWLRSGRVFTYSNWYPGSPYPPPDGLNWNCLGLDPNANYTWVDLWCDGRYQVMTLCEYP